MARTEIEIDKDYKPRYKANKEWQKNVKFNKHWYHLESLYDNELYDFNQPLTDYSNRFDFNQSLFEY
ncbi:MAG: hypothetical protein [Wendovervirus sonii]|uniref:Uncharacterized protein n=1 Tax=phage Lak_Megaphage_Sonny TaxID=3109229 RepID=A0ABZ0Z5J9_9CAUD|nr:MAG: hypothetical protein [phage Lak_Megaphage_Sonny]